MSNRDMGGPAFPVFPETETGHAAAFGGMTLWDYYAAAAVTGGCSSDLERVMTSKEIAQEAARIADAMLAERKRRMGDE